MYNCFVTLKLSRSFTPCVKHAVLASVFKRDCTTCYQPVSVDNRQNSYCSYISARSCRTDRVIRAKDRICRARVFCALFRIHMHVSSHVRASYKSLIKQSQAYLSTDYPLDSRILMFKLHQRYNWRLPSTSVPLYRRELTRDSIWQVRLCFFYFFFPSTSRNAAARNCVRGSAPQFGAARLQEPRQDAGQRVRKRRRVGFLPRWIPGETRAHGDDGLPVRGGAAVPRFPDPLRKLREWIREISWLWENMNDSRKRKMASNYRADVIVPRIASNCGLRHPAKSSNLVKCKIT